MSVTVDVEDWYHVPSVCGSPFSVYRDVDEFFKSWTERYDYLSEPTRRTLDLLDEYDIKATFFVVADVVDHYPGLVESIVERGHEIGCHGLHHSCKIDPHTKIPLMMREEFQRRTLKARYMLESACKQAIVGYRAPNAFLAGWMLEILAEIGFKYDSSVSVNSIYNKTDSALKGVSSCPYRPRRGGLDPGDGPTMAEFPWAYLDTGIRIPTAGGPMLRFLGSQLTLLGLKQSLRRGHTVFYFHPIDISRERFPAVGKGRPFYWAIKGEVVERRIRRVLEGLKGVDVICLKDAVKQSGLEPIPQVANVC